MRISTSVVLCTCNGARFLEAQWESLLAQSRRPDEIFVRDDASNDGTWTLLETLAARAEARGVRVCMARNERNLGYVANFEAALREATGDVLFLCDQDDVWHAEKLATMLAGFEQSAGLLLLCTDARRVGERGEDLRRSLFEVLKVSRAELRRIHAGQGFDVLLRRSLATGATLALRRTLLADALPFPARWVHDEWLAIVAAALGGFDCIEQTLIDYRQHGDNQLGMPERAFSVRWKGLWTPPTEAVAALLGRYGALHDRLRSLDGRIPASTLAGVEDKLDHLRARAALGAGRWRRAPAVLNEAMRGRYRRYAAGWRSALRDLVRRD
jgi:glycosyltransferase involved in cell wall biosynthesis